jgi:hypothetical protein
MPCPGDERSANDRSCDPGGKAAAEIIARFRLTGGGNCGARNCQSNQTSGGKPVDVGPHRPAPSRPGGFTIRRTGYEGKITPAKTTDICPSRYIAVIFAEGSEWSFEGLANGNEPKMGGLPPSALPGISPTGGEIDMRQGFACINVRE